LRQLLRQREPSDRILARIREVELLTTGSHRSAQKPR
jgi:hypothetical protein